MESRFTFSGKRFYFTLTFCLTAIVYAWGLLVPLMEVDAAAYASISREMVETGNYQLLMLRGKDWLDKPHLLFWINAISFKLLGVATVTYKLPSLIIFLVGVIYTYLFAKRFYPSPVAWIATLLLATAWHIVISNNDVWAEASLSGFTIMALYHFVRWLDSKKLLQFIAGCCAAACLLMTKGVFTIFPVASAIFLGLMHQAKWKEVFNWNWAIAVFLISVMLMPSLLCYYYQFDVHPEKEIFGRTGVSAIKFYFWDSQWGRFSNTGPITRNIGSGFVHEIGDLSFFIHSMIWVFAPWAFLAFIALYKRARAIAKRANLPAESYTFFGFVFMFVLFSFSSFQLPHFLNPILSFVSIITADFIYRTIIHWRIMRLLCWLQGASAIVLLVLLAGFCWLFRGKISWDTILVGILAVFSIVMIYLKSKSWFLKLVFPAAFAMLTVNYYLNRNFYPDLLSYQSESEVAFYLKSNQMNKFDLGCFQKNEYAADFYLKAIVPEISVAEIVNGSWDNKFLFTSKDGVDSLKNLGVDLDTVHVFSDFGVQNLSFNFVNHKTRERSISKNYLVKVLRAGPKSELKEGSVAFFDSR